MIFDLVKFAFLALAAADLEADFSSAQNAAYTFDRKLVSLRLFSTETDIPTSFTSDYETFSSALSSFNKALEDVGADDIKSGSTLYVEAARAFSEMDNVLIDLVGNANLHYDKAGNIFSFIQDVVDGMDEPSVQLVEKANSIMVEDCSIAIYGDSFMSLYLLEHVSIFSRRFSSLGELVTVSISSLPTLSCLNGATAFSLLKGSNSRSSAGQSATPVSSVASTGAPQSSILEDSTSRNSSTAAESVEESSVLEDSSSRIDSSTPPESLEVNSISRDSTARINSSNPPGSSGETGTRGETAITSTSRSGAGSSSTGPTSVSSDGAPILAMNAGIFALIVAMLL